MSLQIKVNGSFISLSKSDGSTFKLLNPMFNKIGSHALSIVIPNNKHNRSIFGFPENVNLSSNKIDDYECEFYIQNTFFKTGLISISNASNEEYDASISLDNGSFNSKAAEKSMRNLSFGGIRTIGTDAATAAAYYLSSANAYYPDYDFVAFPIENYNFYDDTAFETVYSNYKYVNYYNTDFYTGAGQNTMTPFPYLSYVLNSIYEEHGYSVIENDLAADNELKNLVLYNTYSASIFYFKLFGATKNISAITQANPCVITATGHGFSVGNYAFIQIQSVVGMTELNQNAAYKAYVVDANTLRLDLVNSSAFNAYVSGGTVQLGAYNMYPNTEVDLSKHMPDITVGGFITAIQSYFNVTVFVNETTKKVKILLNDPLLLANDSIDITNRSSKKMLKYFGEYDGLVIEDKQDSGDEYASERIRSITSLNVKDSVTSVSDLPYTGDVNENKDTRLVTDENNYYTWFYDVVFDPGTWNFWSYDLLPYYYGEEPYDSISSEFSTLIMKKGLDIHGFATPGKSWLVPRADQIGNSDSMVDFTKNEWSPRLLFYRGMKPDSLGTNYPLGSQDIYNYAGIQITGAEHSLRLDGEHGRIEKFFKNWIYWSINKRFEVETSLDLDLSFLINLDFSKKYWINNKEYFFKEIDFKVVLNSIVITMVRLVAAI